MDAHDADAPRRSLWRRAAIVLLAVAGIVVVVLVLAGGSRDGAGADAFYQPPEPLPVGPPGTVVRAESVDGPRTDARAYRILYLSRSHTGRRVALSALLFVPERAAPANRRSIVAVAHGTVGISERCAVSRGRGFFEHVEGLARFVRAGHAVVVPDLEGLGTPGTHPYLVGEPTAHALLDAVRAARRFPPADASERFAVWGVGQGGHAALFAGEQARSYAPELELAGVAAAAPMANLRRLVGATAGTPAGDVVAAYMLATWSSIYAQLRLDDVVGGPSRERIEQVAGLCVPVDHGAIAPALAEQPVALQYRTRRPWDRPPWRELLARNAPGAASISVPVLITQGRDDAFVRPAATARFVRYLCGRGTTVQYRPSPGVAHRDVGEKTAPYVSNWIGRRFAGAPARSACRQP